MDVKLTNAERLDALLEKHAPKAVAFHKEYKIWPNGTMDKSPSDAIKELADKLVQNDGMTVEAANKQAQTTIMSRSGAPYVIKTLPDGRRRLAITTDLDDVIAGVGETMDEALTMLEELR